jgi:hypothetical protein
VIRERFKRSKARWWTRRSWVEQHSQQREWHTLYAQKRRELGVFKEEQLSGASKDVKEVTD